MGLDAQVKIGESQVLKYRLDKMVVYLIGRYLMILTWVQCATGLEILAGTGTGTGLL